MEELREFLCGRAAEIGALLRGEVEIARQALAKYMDTPFSVFGRVYVIGNMVGTSGFEPLTSTVSIL